MHAAHLSPLVVRWPFSNNVLCMPLMNTSGSVVNRRPHAQTRCPMMGSSGNPLHGIHEFEIGRQDGGHLETYLAKPQSGEVTQVPRPMAEHSPSGRSSSSSSRPSFLNYPQPAAKDASARLPLPPYRGQYTGSYEGSFWNTQALFAAVTDNQSGKQAFLTQLLGSRDFTGVAETHGTRGKLVTALKRPGISPFWSHGTASVGGIGLLVKDTFLEKFNPGKQSGWVELIPGRLGRLRLEGPLGSLDIYVTYMHTGSNNSDRQDRAHIARVLLQNMASKAERLSLVMGDFNFVTHKSDCMSKHNAEDSGLHDINEATFFEDTLWTPCGFQEIWQPHFTHISGLAYSRLDRIYSNRYLSDQLDRNYCCYVIKVPRGLSAHHAIAFSRQIPREAGPKAATIADSTIRHPDFCRRVNVEYLQLQVNDQLPDTAFRRLLLVKKAIHVAQKSIQLEQDPRDEKGEQEGYADQVGWIMGFIRAAEQVNLRRMHVCALRCPVIMQHVHPSDPEARSSPGIASLRELVIKLSRQDITEELQNLQEAPTMLERDLEEEGAQEDRRANEKSKRKQNIVSRLKRLLPGLPNTIGAIQKEDDTLAHEPQAMAEALVAHWKKVFKNKNNRRATSTQMV